MSLIVVPGVSPGRRLMSKTVNRSASALKVLTSSRRFSPVGLPFCEPRPGKTTNGGPFPNARYGRPPFSSPSRTTTIRRMYRHSDSATRDANPDSAGSHVDHPSPDGSAGRVAWTWCGSPARRGSRTRPPGGSGRVDQFARNRNPAWQADYRATRVAGSVALRYRSRLIT